MLRALEQRRRSLDVASCLLESADYRSILQRGFAVVTDAEGQIIKQTAQVKPGDPVHIQVSDGTLGATIGSGPVARKKVRPPPEAGGQESLF